jgi:hypothetical protein
VSEKIENLLEELVGEFKTLTTMLGDAMEMIELLADRRCPQKISEQQMVFMQQTVDMIKKNTRIQGNPAVQTLMSQMTDHLTNAGLEDVHKGIRDGTLEPKNRKAYEKHYGRRRPCPEPCPEEKKD